MATSQTKQRERSEMIKRLDRVEQTLAEIKERLRWSTESAAPWHQALTAGAKAQLGELELFRK